MSDPASPEFTRALAFVYFFLAQNGDAEGLTSEEIERIILKVGEWSGGDGGAAPGGEAGSAESESWAATVADVRRTWAHFRGLSEDEESAELAAHAAFLREMLPAEDQRALVVDDLIAVAQADGRTSDVEEALISYVREALG